MFRHIFAKWVTYSDEQWAAIRKYAAIHGNATAVRKFEGDSNGQLSESAVRKEKVLRHAKLITGSGLNLK